MTVEEAMRHLRAAAMNQGMELIVRLRPIKERVFRDRPPADYADMVMRLIVSAGNVGLTTTELTRGTPKIKAHERHAILCDLLAQGLIQKDVVEGKTKATVIWRKRQMP